MKKVLVIGCPGSGKSTFARRLRDAAGLPLYPLDLLWHRPDRTAVSEEEFDPEFREFITHFSETRLPNIYALLKKHSDITLTVFHSRAECEAYEIPAAE